MLYEVITFVRSINTTRRSRNTSCAASTDLALQENSLLYFTETREKLDEVFEVTMT